MEWNLEKTAILAENVQKYPALYDGVNSYNNTLQLQEAWEEIAKAIGNGVTSFACKRRWQMLRSAYRNHVKFGYKVVPVGIEHHLTFLTPYLRSKSELTPTPHPTDSLEHCTKLVQIVREYLRLDVRSTITSRQWKEVAARMGTGDTPKQCQFQWHRLRTRYSFHLKRGFKMKPPGIERLLTFLAPLSVTSLASTVMIVNLIRENPILYEKANSNNQQAVWKQVAEKMKNEVTPQECEALWKCLRETYSDYLQKGTVMQPIGIEDHLTFLKPYLALPNHRQRDEVESEPATKKIHLDEVVTRRKLRRDTAVAAVWKHKHLKFDGKDEDLLFLFEFLEDMARMDDTEKMSFKLDAMRVAEEYRANET